MLNVFEMLEPGLNEAREDIKSIQETQKMTGTIFRIWVEFCCCGIKCCILVQDLNPCPNWWQTTL